MIVDYTVGLYRILQVWCLSPRFRWVLIRGCNEFFFSDTTPSALIRIGSAFGAGVASAFASGPTEMVMTYQKKREKDFMQRASS